MNKQLHMVCPEIPDPSSGADMADAYFQLQFLHEAGYHLILHCFQDDTEQPVSHLENITSCIHIYQRNQGHKGISMRHPYCISSRSDPQLLENLMQCACPVLFQGITATYYLPELASCGYKTIVRINGIASELYEAFTRCEKLLLKKAYSFNEARLVRKWEERISEQAIIVASTKSDQQKFQQLYRGSCVKYLAPIIPMPEINVQPGTGMYCLYYGDLSNPENEKMVGWLAGHIFRKMSVPLIVADTCNTARDRADPSPESNICMVYNPAGAALTELIQKAQLILLPRCHNSGFDKRLLHALGKGRHCVCNDMMIHDTGLENLFIVANSSCETMDVINHYFSRPFTEEDVNERKKLLPACLFTPASLHELAEIIDG